jgi:hypothetical protein
MPRIEPRHIIAARQRVEQFTLRKAEALGEAIFNKQPTPLGSLLVLPQFGVTHAELDVALKILFICHESVVEASVELPVITEALQERCLARVTGRANFLEGLAAGASQRAVQDQIDKHPEPYLLALALGILQENGLANVQYEPKKYLILAVLNVVEMLASAIHDA